MLRPKYNNLMSDYEIREYEKKLHKHGPLSLLFNAMSNNLKVLVSLRSNRKVIGNVLSYDKHFNMVLVNIVEIYSTKGKGKEKRNIERSIDNLFLRGDNVILVVLLE